MGARLCQRLLQVGDANPRHDGWREILALQVRPQRSATEVVTKEDCKNYEDIVWLVLCVREAFEDLH